MVSVLLIPSPEMTIDCFLFLSSVPYPRTLVLFCTVGILLYPVLTLSSIAFCTWKYPKFPGNLFPESEGWFNSPKSECAKNASNCASIYIVTCSIFLYLSPETPSDPRAEVAQIAWWFANRQCLWWPKSFMNSQDEHLTVWRVAGCVRLANGRTPSGKHWRIPKSTSWNSCNTDFVVIFRFWDQ